MSLQDLATIHTVDIQKESVTIGAAMGTTRGTPTTTNAGVKCRISTPSPAEIIEFEKRSVRITHKIYFLTNPLQAGQDPTKFVVVYGSRRILVRGVTNFDELGVYFAVFGEEMPGDPS